MVKTFLAASAALFATGILPPTLFAQTNVTTAPRAMGTCSSGLRGGGPECAPERRLLVVVKLNGVDAPTSMQVVVDMGAGSGGAFMLTPRNATTPDSALFAVLDVTRDAEGNYRIDESSAGPKAASSDNCRASPPAGSTKWGSVPTSR